MKKLFLLSIAVAVLAAFLASSHPDGLDFVAEKLGFVHKAVERTAPMQGYSLSFLQGGGISTSIAGIAGVLIVWLLFWFAVYLLKRRSIV